MAEAFPLVLVSAWNDSGGGFTHRLFDGHSGIFCWPFELQLGTRDMPDSFEGRFRSKYGWPDFPEDSAGAIFDALADDELKGTLLGLHDKFAGFRPEASVTRWRDAFVAGAIGTHNRADYIRLYIESFFAVWNDREASGREKLYLAHCPVIVLDADRILEDFPAACILHVYRNPLSGLGDFRLRHPEISVADYAEKWSLVNLWAYAWAQKRPDNVRLMCLDDLLGARRETMVSVAEWLGLDFEESLMLPSWNSKPLQSMGPFGGVPQIGLDQEVQSAARLSELDATRLLQETAVARRLLASGKSWAPGSIF